MKPGQVYRLLLKHFGPQGWWPVTKPGRLAPQYRPGVYERKSCSEKFEICLGALLTQNTAWTNVEKAFFNIHSKRFCDPLSIASAELAVIAGLIKPSGYYNQKARYCKAFAEYVVKKYGGSCTRLLNGPLEEKREELLSLTGIGQETADSMLLYAGGKPVFVVDAYTQRIGRRLGWFNIAGYQQIQEFFHNNLQRSVEVYNEMHALIVALAKGYCRKKPVCAGCPLERTCPKK